MVGVDGKEWWGSSKVGLDGALGHPQVRDTPCVLSASAVDILKLDCPLSV